MAEAVERAIGPSVDMAGRCPTPSGLPSASRGDSASPFMLGRRDDDKG